jgi:hypothetical protein
MANNIATAVHSLQKQMEQLAMTVNNTAAPKPSQAPPGFAMQYIPPPHFMVQPQ